MNATIQFKIGGTEYASPEAAATTVTDIARTILADKFVEIVGHTCEKRIYEDATVKAFGTNEALATARAAKLAADLVAAGVPSAQIKVTGVGSAKPTGNADIATDRRAEVTW